MSIRYLFNTNGDYVAFVHDKYVFSPSMEWIGFIENGNLFYTSDGQFSGYLLQDDRVARNNTEYPRPKIWPPYPPLKPLTPLKPLKRLRKSKLPHPYEDIFEYGVPGLSAESLSEIQQLYILEGSDLYGADDQFLGKITKNRFIQESLSNPYGEYGSQYSTTSIFNEYGQYGGQYSQLSPFNEYTRTPPKITKNGKLLSYLTVNQFISPRVSPKSLKAWLNS